MAQPTPKTVEDAKVQLNTKITAWANIPTLQLSAPKPPEQTKILPLLYTQKANNASPLVVIRERPLLVKKKRTKNIKCIN